ncbi:MAG: isoleucine--tRNA ligase [Candidatus Omnitrophica bacterium]|nr:isoleucine--tRNA ligase [Candidatus Omnitrophota bacterium]
MSVKPKDYKRTIHLPQTSFSMKANLPEAEPRCLSLWEEGKLYERIRKQSSTRREKFILHDGPPYANGNIHIGHALNKILKDIIVKYRTMRGFNALYVPGWDCHGLPIEHQCLKEMGKRKDEVERVQFRKQARKYAQRFIDVQRKEFKRLGIFGDWETPYRTMDLSYQASIAESFITLYEKGFIEQRLKPVPWCWDCETALADAELEYEDKTSKSAYVKFEGIAPDKGSRPDWSVRKDRPFYFLIWTTTPWTLPANVGLAVHPDLNYVAVTLNNATYVFAEALIEKIAPMIGLSTPLQAANKLGWISGKDLANGFQAKHPFIDRISKVILADYVSATDGTGIVHIAPGHGEEDYLYGYLQNKLDILSPVNEKGRFTEEFTPTTPTMGTNVLKANAKIIELLKEKNDLFNVQDYQHSYPHCWRCKKPIIFRATPQWFLKIDHENLRKRMGEAIKSKIRFTPEWGKNRIGSMVESRPDWCLSRQRYWGVPIPIISCKSCGRTFVSETKSKIVELFKQYGADIWFEKDAIEFFPGFNKQTNIENIPSCCSEPNIQKETDIIDVWFDSGVSHQAVLKKSKELKYPADLYLEGSDQHRGWFQSALTTGMALDNQSPFGGVLTHGFVVDGEGKKMSKSAGNVVAPQDVMKEFGADILRLWVSSCDYQFDVRLSKEILKQSADQYRKIRNTFRYLLGNLCDFDPKKDRLALNKLHPLDQWMVSKVDRLSKRVDEWYSTYDFHAAFQGLHDFCSIDLSSYYFDILKDILYTASQNSHLRRSAQTGLFEILARLVKMLAPILSFTMDEVWRSFPIEEGKSSVHESFWEVQKSPFTSDSFQDWEAIRAIRDAIMPCLEKQRGAGLIGSSLDAKVYLKTDHSESTRILKQYWQELDRVFIVSGLEWMKGKQDGLEKIHFALSSEKNVEITISVGKADGAKCERCWHYSIKVGSFPEDPTLCERCVEAIR